MAKLGIIAGGGLMPARLASACRAVGRDFHVIALQEQADPALVDGLPHSWVRLGAGGETLRRLKDEQVEEIVFAGRVERPSFLSLRPDGVAARFIAEVGFKALGDDSLLRLVVDRVEREGFRVVSPQAVLSDLLMPEGLLGGRQPDPLAERDIARGVTAARRLGAVDVGQAVVVQQGIVLAVEAAEGTDAMIDRAGSLRREGPGGVLVKVSKPRQERRIDLPTVGSETVRRAAASGLRGIAVEAGAALVIDRHAVADVADAAGLFVIGISLAPRS